MQNKPNPLLSFLAAFLSLTVLLGILVTNGAHPKLRWPSFDLSGEVKAAVLGVIIGGLITYILNELRDFRRSTNERRERNFIALLKLQSALSEHYSINRDNAHVLPHFEQQTLNGGFYWARMQEFPAIHHLTIDLLDLDLINSLTPYNNDIRRINDDIRVIQDGYNALQASRIGNQVDATLYAAAAASISKRLHDLIVVFDHILSNELEPLLAQTKLCIDKSDFHLLRLRRRLTTPAKVDEAELSTELKAVREGLRKYEVAADEGARAFDTAVANDLKANKYDENVINHG